MRALRQFFRHSITRQVSGPPTEPSRSIQSQDEILTYCEKSKGEPSNVRRFYMSNSHNFKAITEIKDASLQMFLQSVSGCLSHCTPIFISRIEDLIYSVPPLLHNTSSN